MLTFTRINDRLKIQYNGVDLKFRLEDTNSFKQDWGLNVVNEITRMIKTSINPNILTSEDMGVIKKILII